MEVTHHHRPRRATRAGRLLAAIAAFVFAAAPTTANETKTDDAAPRRVVSMNLCTDQLALLVASPGQIHSLSYISSDPEASPFAREARRYTLNHGLAEEIFLMRPDLILAGAYTRPATTRMLRRLGFRVATFTPAGSFAEIRANISRLARLLGRTKRGSELLTLFDKAHRARTAMRPTPEHPRRPRAALYTANSHTSGRGTLAADIIAHADFDNLATELGLTGIVRLPLELLVINRPELLITGDAGGHPTARAGAALTHPALRDTPDHVVTMDNRWSCGTPAVLDIVRELEAIIATTPATKASRAPSNG